MKSITGFHQTTRSLNNCPVQEKPKKRTKDKKAQFCGRKTSIVTFLPRPRT